MVQIAVETVLPASAKLVIKINYVPMHKHPGWTLHGHFLSLIIKGRIQKGRQKMSIFTPFSLYSIVVIAVEYTGIMAVAQW